MMQIWVTLEEMQCTLNNIAYITYNIQHIYKIINIYHLGLHLGIKSAALSKTNLLPKLQFSNKPGVVYYNIVGSLKNCFGSYRVMRFG